MPYLFCSLPFRLISFVTVKVKLNQKAVGLQDAQLCRLGLSPTLRSQQRRCRKYSSDSTNLPPCFIVIEPFAAFLFLQAFPSLVQTDQQIFDHDWCILSNCRLVELL